MDADAATLDRAVAALQQQFDGQVAGPQGSGQATIRRALEQQLGLDEPAADRLMKQLVSTGRLVYVDPAADTAPAQANPAGGPDPLYAIPGAVTPSGEERITDSATTAGVEATLGGVSTVSGHLGGSLPAVDAGLIGARMAYREDAGLPPGAPAAGQDDTQGYWQIQ